MCNPHRRQGQIVASTRFYYTSAPLDEVPGLREELATYRTVLAIALVALGYLYTLLLRKGISWTRLFADLQEVFPHNVRLVSVRPFITTDNKVQLEMVVSAQSPEPVIQLFRRLESTVLFSGSTRALVMRPLSSQ